VAPLFAVALSALILKEHVRIYRWTAVILGFSGVLVMLLPQLDVGRSATSEMAAMGMMLGLVGALFGGGSAIQTRALTRSEATSSIVLYFSLICTLAGLATWPFGWVMPDWRELTALIVIGICGGLAHILLTESYRLAPASLIAPFDYTSMLWALVLGFLVFGEVPSVLVFVGAGIIAGAGLFVIWRERQLALQRGMGKSE
jgi:drug/metabolite transporter (DMT)-like permease